MPPYPDATSALPLTITPIEVTLKAPLNTGTILPFTSPHQLPPVLLSLVQQTLNDEIVRGDTYPMLDPLPLSTFGPYWFGVFGTVMLKGSKAYCENLMRMMMKGEEVVKGFDWGSVFLGSFYVKPNYPGRSSHVCNAGFLVAEGARGKGVGGVLGEVSCSFFFPRVCC